MKTGNELQIIVEDFKLIKSFYPDFIRKQSESNDFIIGWSELMPVVDKIRILAIDSFNFKKRVMNALYDVNIHTLYIEVVEFIKWYNNQTN